MAKTNNLTARCDQELATRISTWLDQNKMTISQLVIRAVDEYISQDHHLKSVAATQTQVLESLEKMKMEHAHTLEKLK